MQPGHPKWPQAVAREGRLYSRSGDPRSEFYRDYSRILHSTAYRRLKHKTQVFFATENDHICTRIEHVNHVASVSYTIADTLGLNTELVSAIATGHDLGHAPFGHQGEMILDKMSRAALGESFWHEKNSLRFVDRIETLPDPEGLQENLRLTYAVRDGIICHCGEIEDRAIKPRGEAIDLGSIESAGTVPPFTWEGCVVKIADKIAFLGRDIEDAIELHILDEGALERLGGIIARLDPALKPREVNNTVLMNGFIQDLSRHSGPDEGIRLSPEYVGVLAAIKEFNYRCIYEHPRLDPFRAYAELILGSLFKLLTGMYDPRKAGIKAGLGEMRRGYPLLHEYFEDWLVKYSDLDPKDKAARKCANAGLYRVEDERDFARAVLEFISGMTDKFAIRCFNEMTSFK